MTNIYWLRPGGRDTSTPAPAEGGGWLSLSLAELPALKDVAATLDIRGPYQTPEGAVMMVRELSFTPSNS